MGFLKAAALALPLLLATGAVAEDQNYPADINGPYDAIVVGGGPSGLSALSGLGRVNRKTLMIDSGEYRNGATRHMHDVIGDDGLTGPYFRWHARQQLMTYPSLSWTNGTVTSIQAGGGNSENNTIFTVTLTQDGQTKTEQAKKIVLGTGLKDLIPNTPGLQENWGQGIYWCPWCDGMEHANQSIGLLGPFDEAASMVRELSTLNSDFVAFANGTDTEENRAKADASFPDWQRYLDIHNVQVENRTISAIVRLENGDRNGTNPWLPTQPEYDLFRVEFTDGPSIERAAFFTSFPNEQASSLPSDMGLSLDDDRVAVNGAKGEAASVAGVYAVGDCNSDDVTNIPHAMYTGKRTAVYLHVQLAREEAMTALGNQKRDLELDPRAVWEEMNPRDALYAGKFDQ